MYVPLWVIFQTIQTVIFLQFAYIARLNIKKTPSQKLNSWMLIHQEKTKNFKKISTFILFYFIFTVSAVKINSAEIWNLRLKLEILIPMSRMSCPDAGRWFRQHLPPCTDNLLEQWNNSIHLNPRPQFGSIAASRRLKNMKMQSELVSLFIKSYQSWSDPKKNSLHLHHQYSTLCS